MDENKKIIVEKMIAYEKRLISPDHNFNEDMLCAWILEACEFAFDNFKEKDTFAFEYLYEYRVATVGLRLMMGLKKFYPQLKSSQKVVDTILAVIENEKYGGGRHDFILVLWENRLDIPFIQIAQNRSNFWENPKFASTIIWGLVRRKIAGFAAQIQAALQRFTDKRGLHLDIRKDCQKYLANEPKYKHFSVFLQKQK